MEVILILVVIVLSAAGVLGWLFYSLKKHEVMAVEQSAVPISDIAEVIPVPAPVAVIEAKPVEIDLTLVNGKVYDEKPVEQQDPLIAQLKEEVKSTREKAVLQAKNAIEVINKLRDENEVLRGQIAQDQGTNVVPLDNDEVERLRAEILELKARITESNEAMKAARSVQVEDASARSFLNAEAVEALKEDIDVLQRDRVKIEARVEELEADALLAKEKNDFLQYELTKSRAQAVGVERIYDNARKRFEGMARDVHDVEQNNVVLKKQANVLEKGLIDFKRLNSELLKREKLSQYELEHNRTQLSDLENIYQTFRERLETAGVSTDVS